MASRRDGFISWKSAQEAGLEDINSPLAPVFILQNKTTIIFNLLGSEATRPPIALIIMKITSALVTSLLSLGYGVSLAGAQSSYSNICSYNSRTRQANVDGNYKVTYHCASQLSLPDTFHLAGTGVTNAEDCARLCRDDENGCRGAVWGHKEAECWISNTSEGGKIINASDLLYIEPDHNTHLEQCKREKANLEDELEKCRANNGGGDEGSGEKCMF